LVGGMKTTTVTPSPSISKRPARPCERLEADIIELASQLTAASATLTRLIGEYDAAEGWRDWGMRSTAHWLSWKCGMGLGAAREQVRAARQLRELPVIAAEYSAGRLSYAKVRALTRFATAESEAYLAGIARHATGAHIEKLARAARRARTGAQARGQYSAAYLKFTVADDGSVIGSFRLPPAEGAELMQALEAGAGRLPDYETEDDGEAERRSRKRVSSRGYAWVLSAMARDYLDSLIAEATPTQAERYQLVLHSTADQVSRPDTLDDSMFGGDPVRVDDAGELANGVKLHPSTLRRLSCDCPTSTIVEDDGGQPLHMGRRTRRISGRLRRAVEARDRGRCGAPGCSEKATQIHHIRHWANGGPTCLRNLISLCDGHHWVVHEGGFTIVPRSPGRWALLGPHGVIVEREQALMPPKDPLRYDVGVPAEAVVGDWCGERMTKYALDVILTSIGAFEPVDRPQDVSAETSMRSAAA
jgi:hypothetical protein